MVALVISTQLLLFLLWIAVFFFVLSYQLLFLLQSINLHIFQSSRSVFEVASTVCRSVRHPRLISPSTCLQEKQNSTVRSRKFLNLFVKWQPFTVTLLQCYTVAFFCMVKVMIIMMMINNNLVITTMIMIILAVIVVVIVVMIVIVVVSVIMILIDLIYRV